MASNLFVSVVGCIVFYFVAVSLYRTILCLTHPFLSDISYLPLFSLRRRREREQKKLAKAQKGKTGSAVSKKKSTKGKAKTKNVKAAAKKKASKAKVDTSDDAALAASLATTRESSRNRDASGSKGKKAAALKAIREERSSKIIQRDESDSDLDYGDEGASDSDDDYEDEGAVAKPWLQKRKTRLQREASESEESSDDDGEGAAGGKRGIAEERGEDFVEAGLEDYIKVTIPRRRLARWCNEPFFEDAVQNMYVRISVGRDSKKMKQCYRLCKIVGVDKQAAEYKFPLIKNDKPVRNAGVGKSDDIFAYLL